MESFRNIGIIGRLDSAQVLDAIRRLKKFLIDRHLHVILEDIVAKVLLGYGLQTCSWKIMGGICDLVVVVGGDGSVLDMTRALAWHKVPALGISHGSLGLLANIRPDELGVKVGRALSGQYIVEGRSLLDAQVCRGIDSMEQSDVLNDVVLCPGKSTRVIEFELYTDGQLVRNQKVDGLIIVMPTGSTAYAPSAGGPIMYSKLDAIVIMPIYPHMLFSRPIMMDGNNELKIVISPNIQIRPQVSCDGQNHLTYAPDDTVTTSEKPQKLRLIHPIGYNYYEIRRTKLGWSSRPGGDD